MLHIPDDPSVQWTKASFSMSNGECVEVATLSDNAIGVRDSKDPDGPMLCFSRREFDAFLRGAAEGEFDRFR